MTWTAKMEHIPAQDIDGWKKKAEADAGKRHIRCERDPEHPDYFLCTYEEHITTAS